MPAFREREQMLRQTCCTLAPNLTFNTPFGLFPSTVRLILLAINANMCFLACPRLPSGSSMQDSVRARLSLVRSCASLRIVAHLFLA